jgi:hypothetical protein
MYVSSLNPGRRTEPPPKSVAEQRAIGSQRYGRRYASMRY